MNIDLGSGCVGAISTKNAMWLFHKILISINAEYLRQEGACHDSKTDPLNKYSAQRHKVLRLTVRVQSTLHTMQTRSC